MKKWILSAMLIMSSVLVWGEVEFREDISPNIYAATVISVYDGDTFTVRVRTWHRTVKEVKIRLLGVDTPEVRGESKEEGKKVRDYVRDLILGKDVWIYPTEMGKYGRTLAQVELLDGTDLAKKLLDKGYAVKYMNDNVPDKLK